MVYTENYGSGEYDFSFEPDGSILVSVWNDEIHKVAGGEDVTYPGWEAVTKDVMQFTGFKDKNGKEVYESDIVKVTNENDVINLDSDTGIGVIEWLEKWGFWNISKIENSLGDIRYNHYVEVIGNIYENPELMK